MNISCDENHVALDFDQVRFYTLQLKYADFTRLVVFFLIVPPTNVCVCEKELLLG